MTFVKGKSGNTNGRPKATITIAQIKAFAESKCLEAIERVYELMENEDPKIALAACNTILDRGLGKPAQAHEHKGEVSHNVYINRKPKDG